VTVNPGPVALLQGGLREQRAGPDPVERGHLVQHADHVDGEDSHRLGRVGRGGDPERSMNEEVPGDIK
jgi:hypothetical protein